MKKAGVILLAFALIACLFPLSVKASETTDFSTDLTAYLTLLSEERGKEVTKDDIEYVLNIYSESLTDFDSVAGLKDYLGEAVKADYSNLTSIYEKYSLDQNSLTALLEDNGETLDDYIFLNELEASIAFYQDSKTEQEAGFEDKLNTYLSDISAIRGFTVSRDSIEAFLSRYEMSLNDMETVADLKDFLGDVIKSDLSNLNYFQTEYGLSKSDIESRLGTINKTLNDYVFMDDLEYDILDNDDGKITYKYMMDMFEEYYPGITDKLGLTEEEFTKAYQYFTTLKDYYSSEETMNKMLTLMGRLQTLMESLPESDDKVTLSQINEMQDIYKEMQDILKIKISYSILENGKKVPLTLLDLINGKDLENAVLSVDIYTDSNELLMDFNLSADMFGELLEDVKDTPVTGTDSTGGKTISTAVKTITGGKLPKTASNYTAMIIIGALLTVAGAALKLNRKKGDEANAA